MAVRMCTDTVHFTVNRKWGEGRNKPKMTLKGMALVTYFLQLRNKSSTFDPGRDVSYPD